MTVKAATRKKFDNYTIGLAIWQACFAVMERSTEKL
jgi:hypothetical protein